MPLKTALVGETCEGIRSEIDTRWAMNFAAGIEDRSARMYDTSALALPVHPMFLGSPEWSATQAIGAKVSLESHEQGRGVQVSHDTTLHRSLEVGMQLVTTPEIVGVHRHRAGAFQTVKHETRTLSGELVVTTILGAIHRGVDVDGEDCPPELPSRPQPVDLGNDSVVLKQSIPSNACHIYSECARIYNAFHCDIAVARSVGVEGLILHGTGTIARAVSAIVGDRYDGDPSAVTRVAADLKGMVVVPDELTVRYALVTAQDGSADAVHFDAITSRGDRAITGGLLEVRR